MSARTVRGIALERADGASSIERVVPLASLARDLRASLDDADDGENHSRTVAGREAVVRERIADVRVNAPVVASCGTWDESREVDIASTRAEASCDRGTAALACDLGSASGWDGARRAAFARGARELRVMGFDDVDGVASGALGACDLDVGRAVEACLSAR